MKTLVRITAAFVLVLIVGAASAQTVALRYSSWLPTNHWYVAALLPYLNEIEKVTEGRVKVEVLPKMVGSPQSQFDVVRDGLADMSWIVVGYTPGRFKLAEMGELPFNGESIELAPALHRTYQKHFAKFNEFKGVELLAIYTAFPSHIATRTRPVKSIDDFKGLKLRTSGELATKAVTQLGGVPILKSSAEAFEMLSTGAIDGSVVIGETVLSANLLDLLKNFAKVPGGFNNNVHIMAVNPDKWAQISPKDQQAIRAISGEKLARTISEAYLRQNQIGFDAMRKAGYAITEISPEVTAQMKKQLQPIEGSWIDAAKAKGVTDPAAVLAEFRAEGTKP